MKRLIPHFVSVCLVLGASVVAAPRADALVITPTALPANVIAAITAGNAGLIIDSITINANGSGTTLSVGTFTNASGTYGLGSGVVMGTGAVAGYGDGANTTGSNSTQYSVAASGSQDAVLDTISGAGSFFDVTELLITFHMAAGFSNVFFNVVFGSEEFPEFVGSSFIDGFGLLINGTNVAFVGGQPVNINHPNMTALAGTQLDGILAPGGNPILTFGAALANPTGPNTLQFIVGDRADARLDTIAYIGSLGGQNPTLPPTVPEPGTLALLGLAAAATLVARSRRD